MLPSSFSPPTEVRPVCIIDNVPSVVVVGNSIIRGTDVRSSHGIPRDLLDRLLIIRTLPYSEEEMVQIIKIRASTEGLTIDEEAVGVLGKVGSNATLRYAVQVSAVKNIYNYC